MAKKKRHSRAEVATKLVQANEMVTQGKSQSEVARALGVSVMTLYRWRKAPLRPQPAFVATTPEAIKLDRTRSADDRIAELQRWKNGTPHERAKAVRAHAKLDLRFTDLCRLFNLTAEGAWRIVVKGDDWRPEYDMDSERERRLILIRKACRAA